MKLLTLLLRASRRTVALAVVAGLIGGAGGVGLIALIRSALVRDDPAAGRMLAWGFVGLCLAVLATRVASQALLIRLGQGAVHDLYTHLSREILAVPLRELERLGNHRLLATLTEDVPAIAQALLGLPILCVNAAILACCLGYMAWLSPPWFAGVLGFLAAGLLSYQVPVWMALGHLERARQDHDALMKHFGDLTGGVKELKLHGARRAAFLREHLERTAGRLRDRNAAGLTIYAAAGTWGQLLFFVLIGLLLFAPWHAGPGSRALAGGYVLTILYAVAPLETITAWLPILGRAGVAIRAVADLDLSLSSREEGASESPAPDPSSRFECVELAGVTHAYRGPREDGFVLGPIDLALRPGDLIFVAGGNGSGKTTFAKLLVGLYAPESGEVRLDGRPVADEDREAYRQLFAATFADVHLFEHLLGIEGDVLDDRARDYLDRLELSHKVRVEGGRLSTTELSHGQRKRLAMLTAYLEDRPIYVFDEWASDQDPHFKDVFYTRLLPELKGRGKAVVVITHDDRYFPMADAVLRLDYGTLEELRPHHDQLQCC